MQEPKVIDVDITLTTVGALIEALQKLPSDMPVIGSYKDLRGDWIPDLVDEDTSDLWIKEITIEDKYFQKPSYQALRMRFWG